MAIKLGKTDSIFRNELIFTVDAKAVNIDNTLVNLFILLQYNGVRPRARRSERKRIDFESLHKIISGLENDGSIEGFKDQPEATNLWLRANLVNLVYRGKSDKEKISSLRPIHLESYKLRNARNTRDYITAEQVYLMLSQKPTIREELKKYLAQGWDSTKKDIIKYEQLDVDTLGILHLIKTVPVTALRSADSINKIKPIFKEQSELFCDDVRRLLAYKESIPRNVLIDYIKNIISFHLALYIQKLIAFLPKIVDKGTLEIKDDWNVTVDMTGSYENKISKLATKDAELMNNRIYDYIKATFKINACLGYLGLDKSDSAHLIKCLNTLQNKPDDFETYFKRKWNDDIVGSLGNSEEAQEDKELLEEITQYENSYFDKYVAVLVKYKGGYQYKYHNQLIDNLAQKNNERGFMASGRSRKHPRKYVIGTKLLETLVQILVQDIEDGHFVAKSLSIDKLTENIRERYGLVINGINEERFKDADLNTNLAFKENMDALKNKLRQIGFYDDLSDAYILQKVRPRYDIK